MFNKAWEWLVIGLLVVVFLLIGTTLIQRMSDKPIQQMTDKEKIEHKRLLKKHGLDNGISITYTKWNDKTYFMRNGKECELK